MPRAAGPHHPLPPQVITAQQLPKLNREKGRSIVDPFVRVEIHGVPADCSKQQTHHKLNNGERLPGHHGPATGPQGHPRAPKPWGHPRAP